MTTATITVPPSAEVAQEAMRKQRQLQQRRDALKRADHIRTARKGMKKRLKDRKLTIHEVLDAPEAQTWKVADILEQQRQWGPSRTRLIMGALRMRSTIRVEDLGEQRRRELVAIVTAENDRLARRRHVGRTSVHDRIRDVREQLAA